MRVLTNINNTKPADADYPKGNIRNRNTGVVPVEPGTPVIEEVYGDIIQFFQKLVIEAGITENDLPDNVTNGYQLIEAFERYINVNIATKDFFYKDTDIVYTLPECLSKNAICQLSGNSIAYFRRFGTPDVTAHKFNNALTGDVWAAVGNPLSVSAGISFPDIENLADNRIVIFDDASGVNQLKAYNFDGTDFNLAGSLALAGGSVRIAKLATNRIAVMQGGTLQTYDFTGSAFSAVGNPLVIASQSVEPIVALRSDKLFVVSATGYYRVYNFDGADWTLDFEQIESLAPSATDAISFNGTELIISFASDKPLKSYRYDEKNSAINEIGTEYNVKGGTIDARMCFIAGKQIAWTNSNDYVLRLLNRLSTF